MSVHNSIEYGCRGLGFSDCISSSVINFGEISSKSVLKQYYI